MLCTVCYGTSFGLDHGTHGQSVEPDPDLVATMGERDAITLAQVQARYERYSEMYSNCTVVNGNLEIVFLIGPGNQTFSLEFLRSIREVTTYIALVLSCNKLRCALDLRYATHAVAKNCCHIACDTWP